jgi:hypothetical protein
MEETVKNILCLVEENKTDSQFYYTIFKVLTENGKHKNFSSNKNGVFFNMNAFNEDTINLLNTNLNKFLDSKKKNEYIEERRTETITAFSATIKTPKECRNELLTILDNNEFSTSICEENDEDEIFPVSLVKKDSVTRVKKVIKPKVLKGVYERIHRNINNRIAIPLKKEKDDEEDLPFILEKEDQEEPEDLDVEDLEDDEDNVKNTLSKEEEKELFGSSSEEDNDDM